MGNFAHLGLVLDPRYLFAVSLVAMDNDDCDLHTYKLPVEFRDFIYMGAGEDDFGIFYNVRQEGTGSWFF